MIVADRTGRFAPGDRTAGAAPGQSRSAACAMPAVTGAAPAFQRFAYEVARRWELPDSVCDVVALMTSELVDDLGRFGAGLDTSLMLTVDDTAVTLRVREAGRPRPAPRDATVRGGRGPRGQEASAIPRRPVGGARLEAQVLLPEPKQTQKPENVRVSPRPGPRLVSDTPPRITPESLSGGLRPDSGRGMVRAIPRCPDGLGRGLSSRKELPGHFGNAGSMCARVWPPDQRSPDRL
ncbi:hypothetical protein ACH4CE_24115 [Streptomyces gelaticus]|uniref:hypothetical protein n=1 Tax=Streptomyces gelaticus TaxID=285446 RepID=UPI00378F3DA5